MNLSEYRTEVKDRLGIPTLDTSLTDATLDRAINAALKHIANTAHWPWLFVEDSVVLASGASDFLPPPTWVATHYINDSGLDLTLRSLRDVQSYINYAAGNIRFYAIKGDRIVVAPKTSAQRTVLHGYTRSESPLLLSTDAPLMPDAQSDWLINEAALRITIRTNNVERIQQLREEASVARRAALDNVRRTVGLGRIRRTRPSIWQDA